MISSSTSATFTFCPPPLGKPDSLQPRPAKGLDTRNRVVQLGSKDNTCWYSVFNLVRDRFKAPNSAVLPARKFEQLASSLRKALSAHDRSLPDVANQVNDATVQKFFKELTKEKVSTPQIQKTLENLDKQSRSEVGVGAILPSFLNQDKHKNLYDYIVYLKLHGTRDIYENFFTKLDINSRDLFENAKTLDPKMFQDYCEGKDWENLGWQQKSSLLDHFARQFTARRFNLQISSWHPQQPVERLITELQNRGPLVVGGCFGATNYAVPARNLGKKIEGRPIYGWIKTDPKSTNPIVGHVILIVGAEKTSTRELVYYIDPNDDSDPLKPEKQRIYCMSYARLTSPDSICDDYGFVRNDAPPAMGYAWYREKPSDAGDEKSPE